MNRKMHLKVNASEYYPGHRGSVGQSCGVSGPAVNGCGSVNACAQCALLSKWQGKESGSESPRVNAWVMHSQNLERIQKISTPDEATGG